jgi:hypothetical protein
LLPTQAMQDPGKVLGNSPLLLTRSSQSLGFGQ